MENLTEPLLTREELHAKTIKQAQEIALLSAKLKWYEDQLRLAKLKSYGASSEQTHPDQLAMDLFNEVEAEADPQVPEPTVETITYVRKKTRTSREAKLATFSVETIDYRLTVEDQVCPCCAGALHEMSTETRLEIDNNRSERSIKPVVIGRKNFLFSNTPRGAKASAIIYSLVETAKANSLHPYMYLKHLFEVMPQLPDPTDSEALSKLVPWYPSLPLVCRSFSK